MKRVRKKTSRRPASSPRRRRANFNTSHTSLAAVEKDLYAANLVERRRAKKGELLWDSSRELAKKFPEPEKRAIRSISEVFVRSNTKSFANGGAVYGITKRPLDTAHIIKRRQRNGFRPVKYVDEELLERRKIARNRMEDIRRKLVVPLSGAYNHFVRMVRPLCCCQFMASLHVGLL